MREDIRVLLEAEQVKQEGRLLGGGDILAYLNKLESNAEVVLYFCEGEVAGFVAFYCNDPARQRAFISMLLTAERMRGCGVGGWLLDSALVAVRTRGFRFCDLEVNKTNAAALHLYRSKGFRLVEEKSEALLMRLDF